ncbi:unnamed protein product [Brachionus calyciflorus]|uniref:Uncharacterized protein n=1 Tax=Brachionus calyciflorus TaxID=104777 RepID=A0A814CBF4_9BILA|nr:unnamed protein product [Brachionus calyciflorus]
MLKIFRNSVKFLSENNWKIEKASYNLIQKQFYVNNAEPSNTHLRDETTRSQDLHKVSNIIKEFTGGKEFYFDCYIKDIKVYDKPLFDQLMETHGATVYTDKSDIKKEVLLDNLQKDIQNIIVLVKFEKEVEFSLVKSFMVHKSDLFKNFTNATFTLKRNRFDSINQTIRFYYLCTNHSKSKKCRNNKLKTTYYLDKKYMTIEWNHSVCLC